MQDFIIVVGDNDYLNGWYAPKGKSALSNCNRFGRDFGRVKRYATQQQAQKALARNGIDQGLFPARVVPASAWPEQEPEIACPRCGSPLEKDADGDLVCADCLYVR